MESNNTNYTPPPASGKSFTYILYALLGVLVIGAAYYTLERRKENSRRAEAERLERERLEQTISGMSTVDPNTSAASAYVGENKTAATADKNGIEGSTKSTAPNAATTTPAAKPATSTTAPSKAASSKTLTAASKPNTTAKGVTSTVPSAPKGRYLVVVGAFSQIANARTEMEKFVKMGYEDAEVVKYKENLWRVVAKRCSSRSEAEKYENDLAHRGIDANVVDGYKK